MAQQSMINTIQDSGSRGAAKWPEPVKIADAAPFVLVHVACFAALWTGVSRRALLLAAALYVIRMFGITAGLHRYFSHRAFKTGRLFQFTLAFIGQSAAQGGVLWWASKHRTHHRHSDTELDVHSPTRFGFLFAHIGWVYTATRGKTSYDNIKDLTRYPELVWLDSHIYIPALLLSAVSYLIAGPSGLVVGMFWSTVALYHATFCINSLAHIVGSQRYDTGDSSRNNWLLAIFTLGEGWHNNHHYFMASARQGFFWWELDITFLVLRALSWTRVVWDLNPVPVHVLRGERGMRQKHSKV